MNSLHPYFKKLTKHLIVWIPAFALYNFIREYGQVIDDGLSVRLQGWQYWLSPVLIGGIAAILFGTYAYLIQRYLVGKFSFGRTVFISSLGYVVVIMTLIVIAFNMVVRLFELDLGHDDFHRFFERGNHWVLIVYCFIVGFLIEFISEMDRKFGPGNLWRMLMGKYYHPIEEERTLMFLDMRSSTTIAEQLGHIKYSRLLQDCFKDISVVAEHDGHVYQYVGDEAVLSWEGSSGYDKANCVRAYYSFCDRLEERRDHYMKEYGLVPEFKAGVNSGVVTTAEVGDIKREIAFHGDTINTAARIQSVCNDLEKDLLASRRVTERLKKNEGILVESVGELMLKGKKKKVEVMAISRI